MKTKLTAPLIFCLAMLTCTLASGAEPIRFFVGTYTSQDGSRGIYTSQFDTERGTLVTPTLVTECANPAFLALHPSKPYLYAVSETQQGKLLAFQYDQAGRLTPLDEKDAYGQAPCHLVLCQVEEGGTCAIVIANYSSGNVVSFPVLENGKIGDFVSCVFHADFACSGPNKARQEAPHAHGAYFDGTTIAVPDLGIDQVVYYTIDLASAKLSRSDDHANLRAAPGAGPRHLAISKNKRYVYVINELDSTVSVFDRQMTKEPKLVQNISTLTAGKDAAALGNSTAEIELHPNGKFLYASNRGDDSIAVFAVDGGNLTLIQNAPSGGKTPRFFSLDPSGHILLACNQDSDNICVLAVDQETGKLTPTGQSTNISRPVCLVFVQ